MIQARAFACVTASACAIAYGIPTFDLLICSRNSPALIFTLRLFSMSTFGVSSYQSRSAPSHIATAATSLRAPTAGVVPKMMSLSLFSSR